MGGGLMQLVAYGAQDVYLTGNPQITFWKVSYRRHTNFAMESILQNFTGEPTWGSEVSLKLNRTGDLVYWMYVLLDIPAIAAVPGASGENCSGRFPCCDPCDPCGP